MTVKELIDKLSQLDPNLQIFINGYEGGYKDVKDISDIEEIALNVHEFDWMGPHELVKNKYYVKDKSKYEIVKGIIIWYKKIKNIQNSGVYGPLELQIHPQKTTVTVNIKNFFIIRNFNRKH